jgi:Zn-dependent M28 family amino/carboxypeptidase
MNKITKAALKAVLYPLFWRYVSMPGKSFKGRPVQLTGDQLALQAALTARIEALSTTIGIRHHNHGSSLSTAATHIQTSFEELGFKPFVQQFEFKGTPMHNIGVIIPGRNKAAKWVVAGAHYDTVPTTPGADDNASGVAALLELAKRLKDTNPERTICLCAYANEEHNGGAWENMGSYAHARSLKEQGIEVEGMISLEMLGYFSQEEGSQKYPFPFNLFYPTKGNFIGFVANTDSADFVRYCIEQFRLVATVPSEGTAAPEKFGDIGRSDHWAFWRHGWPAFMLTDTSNFRTPYVHTMQDTIDTLDLDSMTRVVVGIEAVILKLANR